MQALHTRIAAAPARVLLMAQQVQEVCNVCLGQKSQSIAASSLSKASMYAGAPDERGGG